ncbi:AAA family ATPase [Armatimonadetes bacterium Uphvl-Ar1]|nr:AAA family ATPase [Armatimonadetes bacterium Uphvl-Ar1]
MAHKNTETTFVRSVRLAPSTPEERNRFPHNLPILHGLESLELHPRVTFLVGENGSGKSTLIEALAISAGMNAEGGSRNFSFSTRASHSDLHKRLTLVKNGSLPSDSYFLRAETFYNVSTEIERLDEGGGGKRIRDAYGSRALHEQSHGESFLSLVSNRFRGDGLYFLDEPEAALSPRGILRLIATIDSLVSKGSQFIISTHSPVLMCYPDCVLYEVKNGSLKQTSVTETDHFQLSLDILTNPVVYLRKLME